MTTVAVIAHSKKSVGGGLAELREVLADAGVSDPLWYEVKKSKKVPKKARRALEKGADLVFLWGGDGTVQRGIDALAGSDAAIAIIPAGTANLLASNLDIPDDIGNAVRVGLDGARRKLDVGVVNGERFAVMAGTGFDALMIRDANRQSKDRFGRLAYIASGARHLRRPRMRVRVKVDGRRWFQGKAACVLVGNVGTILGGITLFNDAEPDDGRLDVGVATAAGSMQWARVLGRAVVGRAERSPLVETTSGHEIEVRLEKPVPYELDGGDRPPSDRLTFEIAPHAITICVPEGMER
jgi:diacylglycerol kinase (ATP)